MNIDQQEINKFSELSTEWWDPTGKLKTLHEINPIRLAFIQAQTPLHNLKVIDIGCGGGILAESMAQVGAHVTGIDMSAEAIAVAQAHWQQAALTPDSTGSLDYHIATAEQFATQRPAQYDVVTCLEMLEHVPDPLSVIKACAELVKPGGHLFFSTINRNPKAYLFAILGAEYCLKLLPKGTHDFAKFIKPSELASWTRAAGLDAVLFKGLHYKPFTKQHALHDDISVNYLLYCQRSLN